MRRRTRRNTPIAAGERWTTPVSHVGAWSSGAFFPGGGDGDDGAGADEDGEEAGERE
jgi:hypothetical protein